MATAATQWRVLADVGETLSRNGGTGSTWAEVTSLLVPDATECCVLYLASDDNSPDWLEVAHIESGRVDEIRDSLRRLLTKAGSARVLSALNANGTRRRRARQTLLARLGLERGTVSPIRTGGRPRGLILLASGKSGSAQKLEVEFGRALADRIGLELECVFARQQSKRAVAASELAVGIVSHDLGNPLATIQICTNALLDPEPQPAEGVCQIAQILQRSTAWMQQIIRDLLDRVSLDAGPLPIAREATVVNDIVGTIRAMFLPLAEEHGLEFVIQCDADLPPIDADPHRLQQVLANLLNNAVKFTPAGGRVTLAAHLVANQEQCSGVRFSVSDTGPGIPEEDLPHVFDWFWHSQVGERTSTGLGLAIAKGAIEAHGARLRVKSAPGRGTTFWFTLPICEGIRATGAEGLQ
jgi:signal transduction histidine kinase